jgi:hypothetical protein
LFGPEEANDEWQMRQEEGPMEPNMLERFSVDFVQYLLSAIWDVVDSIAAEQDIQLTYDEVNAIVHAYYREIDWVDEVTRIFEEGFENPMEVVPNFIND